MDYHQFRDLFDVEVVGRIDPDALKRMILTNEHVNAATALHIGLVEEVVSKGESLDSALRMVDRVASLSPQAAAFSKQLIQSARQGVPRTTALALERERFINLFDWEDQRESVNSFSEKRKAVWKNG
jgi:enoyl-CoA hydratase/carnithine racemase